MNLIILLLVLALIGAFAYVLVTYVPMPPIFRAIIVVVAAIVAVLYALNALGIVIPNVRLR